MSPLLPLGLAIVLNVSVLGVGGAWMRRQVKRAAAEREVSYRSLFLLDPLPPAGDKVQILVEDNDGRTSQIDAVHWPHLGWTDAVTLLRVEDDVLGWRRHPFRQEPPPVDCTSWTKEEIAAEMERRFGQSAER